MPLSSRRLRLAPSLLSADFAELGSAVKACEAAGADSFHLDVMDGHFVPNISFGPALVAAVRARTKLPLDVHLMIQEPARHVEAFAKAGGDTLVFHAEAEGADTELIHRIHDLGTGAGIALRPGTPIEGIEPWIDRLDQVMVMGVHPGFSGQKFIPDVRPKIRRARALLDAIGSKADISLDGGVTVETAALGAEDGATFFVCGNSVFSAGSIPGNLGALRAAVEKGAAGAVR